MEGIAGVLMTLANAPVISPDPRRARQARRISAKRDAPSVYFGRIRIFSRPRVCDGTRHARPPVDEGRYLRLSPSGTRPRRQLPRLRRVIDKDTASMNPADYPKWTYDGSSTDQAPGNDSDLVLNPVKVVPDPIRGGDNVLVMCDVYKSDGKTPVDSNHRAPLAAIYDAKLQAMDPWYGFEQEYTMMSPNGRVYGWPEGNAFPAPQGPFYCGVGSESVYGRPLAEAHMDACIKAGLTISGINAEVMPGQWEFQIGPIGPLELGDQVMIARWLLHRLGEDFGIAITLDPKPQPGDWNGTGGHTNFSTLEMRQDGGIKVTDPHTPTCPPCCASSFPPAPSLSLLPRT